MQYSIETVNYSNKWYGLRIHRKEEFLMAPSDFPMIIYYKLCKEIGILNVCNIQ